MRKSPNKQMEAHKVFLYTSSTAITNKFLTVLSIICRWLRNIPLLIKPKFDCRFHNCLPINCIHVYFNYSILHNPLLFILIVIVSSYLHPGLHAVTSHQVSLLKLCTYFLSFPAFYTQCPYHHFDFITFIIVCETYKL